MQSCHKRVVHIYKTVARQRHCAVLKILSASRKQARVTNTPLNLTFIYGLGANQRYVGYFSKSLHPPGSKFCLLSGLIGMFWCLKNPCCTKLSVAGFLQTACKVCYPGLPFFFCQKPKIFEIVKSERAAANFQKSQTPRASTIISKISHI